jgi:hypothetical protein
VGVGWLVLLGRRYDVEPVAAELANVELDKGVTSSPGTSDSTVRPFASTTLRSRPDMGLGGSVESRKESELGRSGQCVDR